MTKQDRLEIKRLKVFKEQILASRKLQLSREEQIRRFIAGLRGER